MTQQLSKPLTKAERARERERKLAGNYVSARCEPVTRILRALTLADMRAALAGALSIIERDVWSGKLGADVKLAVQARVQTPLAATAWRLDNRPADLKGEQRRVARLLAL
jgi:hypothetical protein